MKTMTWLEIDHELNKLRPLHGFTVTNVLYNEQALQLSLSSGRDFYWLTFSLKPGHPYFFVGDAKTPKIAGLKKPLSTFALTHLKGEAFVGARRIMDQGRVVELAFSDHKIMEVLLFPGGQNITLSAGEKVVHAYKPKDLLAKADDVRAANVRQNLQNFYQHWSDLHGQRVVDNKNGENGESAQAQALNKKRNGLKKMLAQLDQQQALNWGKIGEQLKIDQSLVHIADREKELLDFSQSLSWNIENCFAMEKKNQEKRVGTLARIAQLTQEIADLESGLLPKSGVPQTSLLKIADAQGRTRELADGTRLFVGKSAKDNLALLRKAKPWYVWLHIRDYPGAYGIIERQRNSGDPNFAILREAGHEILKHSVKSGISGVYEVIFAECRYVRPIPKIKAGQVTYSHEKVIRITI